MKKHRGSSSSYSRRKLLQSVGVAGLASVGGCIGGDDDSSNGESMTIAILAAGSLQHALETGLKPGVDVPVQIEAHGSATVARMIAEGQRDPDIVTVADTALFEEPLSPPWYSIFTSNAVVIAYNQDTEGGQQVGEAGTEQWYEPMVNGDVSIGRTDPDQDPLGYRSLFTLELASRYYEGASNLGEKILSREQIYPETGLITQFETGSIDAAFAYRNMAVERDYEYIELPGQINLSNPKYAGDWYSTVSYTLPSDHEIQGGLISYGSTIRKLSDAAMSVFDVHTTGDHLDVSGFILRDQFPMYEGTRPSQLRDTTRQSSTSRSLNKRPIQPISAAVSDLHILI